MMENEKIVIKKKHQLSLGERDNSGDRKKAFCKM